MQFRDEFFCVFRQLSERDPSQICGILLDYCADPTDETTRMDNHYTTQTKQIDYERIDIAHSHLLTASQNLRVLQLTDLHIDFEYQPNSEADCVMPVYCRQTAVCSYQCTDEKLAAMVGTLEIDYIMLSGDLINHVDWAYTVDGHIEVLKNISLLVYNYFSKIPTYSAVGNQEGVPVNSFLYLNPSDPDVAMSWIALELLKFKLSGESVHVLSHIPPGDSECLEGWARNYYRVIQRFYC
ncbi:hypothetical protein DICVIV_06502 [Dictyocaulus viviparus]|uniref:Uncharacterized protein n=1 Tax=Dictyocaulus viviparus TaxID=29172 RepID=A0A0D8XYI9_DICVI|nr:hypothetical protein DICVIV_06502 [Dictyocaulus viviparus]